MSTYINLGSAGGNQPSTTPNGGEVAIIKSTLQIGTASILDAAFDTLGNITLTDIITPTNSIVLYKSGTETEASKLTSAQQFSIFGDIAAPPIAFDGQLAVRLNATIQDNSVRTSTIATGAIVQSKLSPGAPIWSSSGNLSITNATSSDNNFNIGDKRSSDNSSTLNFQTQGSTLNSIVNASISRASGVNGDFVIKNTGAGLTKFQTDGPYDRVIIDSTGKVGIGTTPNYPLHVETGSLVSSPAIYVAPSTAGNSVSNRAGLLLGNWGLYQDSIPSGSLDFVIKNTRTGIDSIYIKASDSRVGIGTNILTAGATLTVGGTLSATNFSGNVTGTASGNVIATSANSITIDASTPAAPTIQIGSVGFATNTWPISITGNAATATTATTVSNGSITASKLNGAQTGSAPIYGARGFSYSTHTLNSSGAEIDSTIQNGHNIARIEYLGTPGKYNIYFTTPMDNLNYSVFCLCSINDYNMWARELFNSRTTSKFMIQCVYQEGYNTYVGSPTALNIVVFA